jgi:hypothetical protein
MIRPVTAIAGFVCVLAAAIPSPVARAGNDKNPRVMPVNSKPHGLSYAEWSARHWQWLFSFPADEHPLTDTAPVSAGQSGEVWFLGGTFSAIEIAPGVILGQADRTGTIRPGKKLFFPLVDVEGSTLEGNGNTDQELLDFAKTFGDFIVPESLFLEIDGKPVDNLYGYRVQSPVFTFGPLPEGNIFGAPAGATSRSASDGVFVMLKPLSAGKHTIHFGGAIDLSSIGGPLFMQDIKYTLTVKAR